MPKWNVSIEWRLSDGRTGKVTRQVEEAAMLDVLERGDVLPEPGEEGVPTILDAKGLESMGLWIEKVTD